MWKEAALATAVLAAVPQFLHAPARGTAVAPTAGKTFRPACRDGQVPDGRPDPAWVRASFSRDNCIEPALPATFDGARASRDQVVAATAAANAYGMAAAAFQKCIADFPAARALTPAQRIIETHRILLSQHSAARARAQARAEIVAFNAYGSGCDDP